MTLALFVATGCSGSASDATPESTNRPSIAPTVTTAGTTTADDTTSTTAATRTAPLVTTTLEPPPPVPTTTSTTMPPRPGVEPPGWIGTRVLDVNEDGRAIGYATPPELVDRRFRTEDLLPPPIDVDYAASVEPIPDDVLVRSSWRPECPVGRDQLRYLTVTFWGFDEAAHTGELIVHVRVADDIVEVFRRIYEARFPIEEMRVVRADEIDEPPTGDGNNTTAFVCRPATGSTTSWSAHAFGLAVDVNPFHNPYKKGDWVLPELAAAYLDRADIRAGMIVQCDAVEQAFRDIGWGWGGDFRTLIDWMHFSESGH